MKNRKIITLLLAAVLVLSAFPLTCLAEGITVPSVGQKGAPELIPIPTADGGEAIAIVSDEDGNEVYHSDDVIITPYVDKENAPEQDQEDFEEAYTEVTQAEKIADVFPDLMEQVKKYDPTIKEEELVVTDLFDLWLPQECLDLIASGEGTVVRIRMSQTSSECIFVVIRDKNGEWKTIPIELVRLGTGYIDVHLKSAGQIAFVSTDVISHGGTEESPYTKGFDTTAMVSAVVAAAAVVLIVVVLLRKKDRA